MTIIEGLTKPRFWSLADHTHKETHMAEQSANESTRYRIGAVARLTGISPDALRIWERRYAAVSPQRSPRGGRLYSARDVARLRLMKELVDAGDAIGEVANLDIEALQARAAEAKRVPSPLPSPADAAPCRLLLVGNSLATAVTATRETLTRITPVATYRDIAEFEARGGDAEADVLVIEQATLHADSASRVVEWLARAKAAHAVIVYRYASADALLRLPASKCSALHAPIDPRTLQAHCLSMTHPTQAVAVPAASSVITQPAPPRRYDDETLAQLATLSSTVKCECPRHLAELIASLSAFERYSTECESRNPRDAALHAFLYATTAHARHLIEGALDQLIEMEDIKL
jgi:DNA-binding transcriptional MerR regulator